MRFTKVVFFAVLISCSAINARAQDTISLRTGQRVIAPIVEVGEAYILYNKADGAGNPHSVSLSVSEIRKINYKSGYVEYFEKPQVANNDKIEFTNGKTISCKVIELDEHTALLDVASRDTTVDLSHVATITYANGYTEKYNAVSATATDEKKNTSAKLSKKSASKDLAIKESPGQGIGRPTGTPPKPGSIGLPPLPVKLGGIAKNGEIHVVDSKDKIILGIGYMLDSVSNISDQYYVYDLLIHNPIITADKKKVIPVLTLRSGLCDYYVSGKIGNPLSNFTISEKGEVKARFSIPITTRFSYNEVLKYLYINLAATIANEKLSPKSVRLTFPDMPVNDFAATKKIRYNVLLNATNYTPPLDDYPAISREYLKPIVDIDTAVLSKLLSYSFVRLSAKAKSKNPDYVRYSTILESYNNILPEYPDVPVIDKNKKMQLYWLDNNIEQRDVNAETMKYLEGIYPAYTSEKLKGFFFESTLVDYKAKEFAKKTILPLYKRPGVVLTYLQCGKNLMKLGDVDAAIESFSSGLLMMEDFYATSTTVTFREYLKASLFVELAKAYEANNQMASAAICKNLAGIHQKLYNSNLFDTDNRALYTNTQQLITNFEKIEADALDARSKKRASFWTGILSVTAAAASAYADGASGATTISAQTATLTDAASGNFNDASNIKQASVDASGQAADAFSQSYGDMVNQLHSGSMSVNIEQPLFAMDLIEIVSNKMVWNEINPNVREFMSMVPAMRPLINKYFQSSDPKTLDDIYVKFGNIELDIDAKEGTGQPTSQGNLNDYK